MNTACAEKIRQGDSREFACFYAAEFDNLVYFIDQYLHDTTAAEDLASESLWTLWERRETIDPERNIRALVFTMAKNRAINFLRSKIHHTRSIDRDRTCADLFALQDSTLMQEIDALSLQELIQRTFDALPDTSKESFILSRKQGLSNKEISERRHISIKTVEYHIKISLRFFREQLKEYFPIF